MYMAKIISMKKGCSPMWKELQPSFKGEVPLLMFPDLTKPLQIVSAAVKLTSDICAVHF